MTQLTPAKEQELNQLQRAPLSTPTDLTGEATRDITGALNAILADVFALYLKTKNFHWHLSGPHFRDYHLMFDEQADQLFAMTDPIAERVRKFGGSTLKSIRHVSRLQRVLDNDADHVDPGRSQLLGRGVLGAAVDLGRGSVSTGRGGVRVRETPRAITRGTSGSPRPGRVESHDRHESRLYCSPFREMTPS